MEEFFSNFSNREIALIIWSAIFTVIILLNKNTRVSIKEILKALLEKEILISISGLTVYSILIIYGFYEIDIWDNTLIKDSIFWFVGSALMLFFNINKAKTIAYFIVILRESLKLTILIEFLINFYVFDLVIELIILPFMWFITMAKFHSELKGKSENLFKTILSYTGIALSVFVSFKIFIDFGDLITINNLKSILLPPLFTILLLPFIYILALYINYEALFIRIDCIIKDEGIRSALKNNIFLIDNINLNRLNNIAKNLYKVDFNQSKDFISSLKGISN